MRKVSLTPEKKSLVSREAKDCYSRSAGSKVTEKSMKKNGAIPWIECGRKVNGEHLPLISRSPGSRAITPPCTPR
ncbi:hypothetical protein J6590_019588 [Homalodisca vitripennis]|nr:hypothetical protein J6590_019588 [Homalodisca vitripennis]